ncbi:MAG: NAD(P)H-hydrate dehydratase [Clostridiales Family XIII bacterium]|jgi:NAD(P)H-hydrate epimerase|nr:NAD(P)H-hydrate dehydratase [Clostridiales Family XIII bacterium]
MKYIIPERVAALLPPRDPDTHKGQVGRVLIAAGSPGMAGAAVLAAGAALRSGAGLVYVSADEALWPIIQTREPCAICVGRPGGEALEVADECVFGGYSAVVAGPGLGTGPDAEGLVSHIVRTYRGPLVLDADALNIIAGWPPHAQGIRSGGEAANGAIPHGLTLPAYTVITPHPGEAARLLGAGIAEVQTDRSAAAAELARMYGSVVVLKGRGTLVTAPPCLGAPESDSQYAQTSAAEIFENTTGNPGMATAGSGDVLTGVIASFAARGMGAMDAAMAGVFIHGLAGDIAAAELGEYGLVATDIMAALPVAILRVTRRSLRHDLNV